MAPFQIISCDLQAPLLAPFWPDKTGANQFRTPLVIEQTYLPRYFLEAAGIAPLHSGSHIQGIEADFPNLTLAESIRASLCQLCASYGAAIGFARSAVPPPWAPACPSVPIAKENKSGTLRLSQGDSP
jgi:hypothetical protein